MDKQQYQQYASEGFNLIPVMREVMADLDTPLSAYLKLAHQPYSYLFESVQGGEKWGRYSIIGLPSSERLVVSGNQLTHIQDKQVIEQWHSDSPLSDVEQFQQRFRVPELEQGPRFFGGLVGYFGYDTVRYVETRLTDRTVDDPIGTPDILIMVSKEVVIFDNLSGKLMLVVHADGSEDGFDQAQSRLDQLEQQLRLPSNNTLPPLALVGEAADEASFTSSFGQQQFESAVERVKEYILDGDCMQVVLSQRLTHDFEGEPLNLYRALRTLNPSPYLYFLNLGEFQIAGSSPEILARYEEGEVTVRPIAGTRRRGKTDEEDLALEQEMLADPKEIAEHLMLIDLGRNDVGRIAKTGSVSLTEKMKVERYSHVMHITSNVTGEVDDNRGALDVLKATLPAGTLSGAPKVRAMEIIDELENVKRGVYGGAIGYLSWAGDMDTAIAIRTAVIKDNKLHIQAGAGVVADSVPALEWKETMNKARAVIRAASMAKAKAE